MEKKRNLTSNSLRNIFAKRWLLLFTLATVVVFGIISPAFLKMDNLLNILSSACIVGVMGVGLTCIFATGELDFSAGSQVSLASCLMAVILGGRFDKKLYSGSIADITCSGDCRFIYFIFTC